MAGEKGGGDDVLGGYQWFDETVDIVSAFEYLYTEQAEMASTVRHFERFPSVPNPSGGDELTPDFTVLFVAGTGTAVSMEPTLSDEDPVGLVPLADLLEPFGAAG